MNRDFSLRNVIAMHANYFLKFKTTLNSGALYSNETYDNTRSRKLF